MIRHWLFCCFFACVSSTFSLSVLAAEGEEELAEVPTAEVPLSEECIAFATDINANLGDVIKAGCEPTLEQMSALMDNPVGNVAIWFNQYDSFFLENEDTGENAIQGNYMGILQFPKSISENWNLINRFVYNVTSSPIDQDKLDDFNPIDDLNCTPTPGGGPPNCDAPIQAVKGRTTGLGDSYYVGLFSPKEGISMGDGQFVWGLGFDAMLPTAGEDVLGTGKWGAGPAALAVYLGPKWKYGVLAQQYFDVGGSDKRDDVNLSNIQYVWYYGLSETTSIGAMPNIIIDWEQDGSDRFTVPVGLGVNSTVQLGKVPVRVGVELYYSAIQPSNIPSTEWNLRFFVAPAAPAALFDFMQ